MDALKQVGKTIGKNKRDAEYALSRFSQNFPLVERARDVFNGNFPFLMEFRTDIPENSVLLNLYFMPLVDVISNVCESYDGSDEDLTLSHPYIAGSVTVTHNGTILIRGVDNGVSEYVEHPPDGDIVVNDDIASGDGNDDIVVCYTIDTSLEVLGSIPFYPEDVRIWMDNVDITQWAFGAGTLNPDEDLDTWRDIDISSFVRGQGLHKLKITASSRGKVEAKMEIR